jgi:hypothetical protein
MKMDDEDVRLVYLARTAPKAKAQLLSNYIQASDDNWALVDNKARWLTLALYLALAAILLLILAVAIGLLLTQT